MRARTVAATAAALAIAACVGISEPSGGVFTVSDVRAPFPAVVVGDTMRDSLGRVAPLRLVGLTSGGDTVQETPTWVTLDRGVRITPAGLVIGDSIRGGVRVVGQLGGLQTPPATINVVPQPTVAVADAATTGVTTWSKPLGDTTHVPSGALGVRVLSGTTAVQGWLVTYTLVSPAPGGTTPAAMYLASGVNRPSRVDTTDASGLASRVVVLRPVAAAVGGADTAVVRASVRYRGQELQGSPILFTVPFRRQ